MDNRLSRSRWTLVACVALVVALAACGGGDGTPDAGDGAGDGAPPMADAAPGTVSVRVYRDNELATDVAVYYHDAAGALVETATTDAYGLAVFQRVPSGGMVTAPVTLENEFFGGTALTTVMGVQPGESITIGLPVLGGSQAIRGELRVQHQMGLAGDYTYRFDNGCLPRMGSTIVPRILDLSVRDGCLRDGDTVDLIGLAFDDGDQEVGHAQIPGIVLTNGASGLEGTVTVDTWSTELGTLSVTGTNLPSSGQLSLAWTGARGGVLYGGNSISQNGLAAGESATHAFGIPNGFYDAVTVYAGQGARGLRVRTSDVPTPASPGSFSFDLAAELLPEVTGLELVTSTPMQVTHDFAAPPSCAGVVGAPDLALFTVLGSLTGSLSPFDEEDQHQWQIFAPGSIESPLVLPDLAGTGAEELLWPQANFLATLVTAAFTSDSAIDYDDMRTSPDFGGLDVPRVDSTRCTTYAIASGPLP